jgi:hypothetical protein
MAADRIAAAPSSFSLVIMLLHVRAGENSLMGDAFRFLLSNRCEVAKA